MTKDQLQEFENYAFELKHNRDYYSRAKIIELLVEKVRELSKSSIEVSSSEVVACSHPVEHRKYIGRNTLKCGLCGEEFE